MELKWHSEQLTGKMKISACGNSIQVREWNMEMTDRWSYFECLQVFVAYFVNLIFSY